MRQSDAELQPLLAAAYAATGHAVLARFVDPDVAAGWERKYRPLPGKRVHVGHDYQTRWTEQQFSDPSEALDGLAYTDSFLELVAQVAGLRAIDRDRTEVWINRYRPGEYVPLHCDRAGSTQLLLCLQGLPEPEQGGDLVLRDQPVPLRTGDAVLFFARGVPHATTPILSSRVGPSGFARVTCVIRLYAPYDPEGAPA
jgi:hypothetical protein